MPVGKSLDSADLGGYNAGKVPKDNACNLVRGSGDGAVKIHPARQGPGALPPGTASGGEDTHLLPRNIVGIVSVCGGKFLGRSLEECVASAFEVRPDDTAAVCDEGTASLLQGVLTKAAAE